MRPSLSLLALSILSPTARAFSTPARFEPFVPSSAEALLVGNDTIVPADHELLKRAGSCAANYNSCSSLAAIYSGACCSKTAVCTTDRNANVACCATGATCTGTIASQRPATTVSATATAKYVSNTYFPFPVIPTTYTAAADCTAAYSACQSNFALCTVDLTGGGYGVTVSAIGGGITVAPTATNLGYASATSICGSLSQAACMGLQTSLCAQYGSGTDTTTTAANTVFVVGSSNQAPRPTMGCMAAMGAVGVGLGIAGQLV
ncbi:hypothetical protein BP5796_08011 [Coleophoma crateriformis]|uniref:Uncharacterized protein n=1 Tax=Coleophoma crateriformis TaxID=565419 RepID=A0A3D8RD52_9HELO|nr:hypothetical protein BP5796_08011 [Coleophoma crateriformis]